MSAVARAATALPRSVATHLQKSDSLAGMTAKPPCLLPATQNVFSAAASSLVAMRMR